jgi:Protein of unknown function (DUF3152)
MARGQRARHVRKGAGRRPVVVVAVVLATLVVAAAGVWRSGAFSSPSTVDGAAWPLSGTPPSSGPPDSPAPAASGTPGAARFRYVSGPGAIGGTAGQLRRYRVAVEGGIDEDAAGFAAAVDAILADPRGWTAGGRLRLQRVAKSAAADFTVFLATPETSEAMCATAGLHTQRYASCRLPGQIIINLDRWQGSVPNYGAPLEAYRAFALNHELGHELGHGHETCPAPGRLAPVMQQQTYGLAGCLPNAWPYVDGKPYSGPPVP